MDPINYVLPSSPTNSSPSSSDLDTESTGSFFHDRSTTLGTLMGVSFPADHLRQPSASRRPPAPPPPPPPQRRGRRRDSGRRRRRQWWRLCREESRAPSLADFLQVERRGGSSPSSGRFSYGEAAAELEAAAGEGGGGGGGLFEDGRVLPPRTEVGGAAAGGGGGSLGRLPVMLTGICSGGEG
ncbi:hypothetical protein QJS04_geneDACA017151 [Acorus gramineus]|uniref:Uncharacterized protein n=1 Tax=Acorus gramineus TaxID=55184 RepID=A0AAV9BRH8_ACOGR|nr:hypothetical protein QJS04_geneDACA017151 [Acorus gramineus]